VVHRPRYDDWSLPKGKVDPGESHPATAVREIREETGFESRLGRRLAVISYPVEGAVKRVVYWAAGAGEGEFSSNDEVDELLWLPPKEAVKRLQYQQDRKVLRRFAKAPADTATTIIVRHARAGSRSKYKGEDCKRPLDKLGRAQAESLVSQLLAFGVTELHAAPRVRCRQTLEPLAQEISVPIDDEAALTDEAYDEDKKAARARVLEIASGSAGVTPVICTQGKVIPDLIAWWCERDGVRPDKSRNRKGSTWVLSSADGRLISADHIGSPLAVLD
jgi:8-oxo-dGTP diphosphatase